MINVFIVSNVGVPMGHIMTTSILIHLYALIVEGVGK